MDPEPASAPVSARQPPAVQAGFPILGLFVVALTGALAYEAGYGPVGVVLWALGVWVGGVASLAALFFVAMLGLTFIGLLRRGRR